MSLTHLNDLRRRHRCSEVIHLIGDYAKPHYAKKVQEYLAEHAGTLVLNYLPALVPQTDPNERAW